MLIWLELAKNEIERNFGVVVESLRKMSTQCVAEMKRRNSMLSIIRKETGNKMVHPFILLEIKF